MVGTRHIGKRSVTGGVAVALVLATQVAIGLSPAAAVPGSLTVTTTADIAANAGACGNTATVVAPSPLSLREAVCIANNLGGAVTITVPVGTFVLSNGELDPGTHSGQNVTINGAGSASTIINGNNASRVLDFDPNLLGGVSGTVSGLTVTHGADSTFGGAGIIAGSNNAGTADSLTVSNTLITANAADAATPAVTNNPGGGIQFIGGSLTITNSTISNNTSADSPGSGVVYDATGSTARESLTVTNSTFSGNSATSSSLTNGGALDLRGLPTTQFHVTGSQFTNNSVVATTGGGALGAGIRQESGALTVTGSTFTGNSVTGGTATPAGGAVEITTGTAALHDNRFTGNVASSGSAVHDGSEAGAVDATENWFGCNTGPGTTGCDTVAGFPVVAPRLVLTGSATPATVNGPNATSALAAALTTDSAGAAVNPASLTAFAGLPIGWTDPQPAPATVSPSTTTLASGVTTGATYNSQSSIGSGHVVATLDNGALTIPISVDRNATVTTNPADQTVTVGSAATFTAAASGNPTPTVQWQRSTDGGDTFANISGATSATLTFTTAAGDNQNSYRAVFSNLTDAPHTATTTAATLTVTQAPAFISPATATFVTGVPHSVTITTSGLPTVTAITESGTLPDGLTFTDNGDGTATLSGTPDAGTGGTYPVGLTAVNGVSPAATQTLVISVNQAPAVTTDPASQTVNPGTSVTFTAAATGVPTPTVQWQRSTDGGDTFTNIDGATSTTLTFTAIRADDGNEYQAVFTNLVNTATTKVATLHVGTAPAFTSSAATTFAVGTTGSFAITSSGVPDATVTTTTDLPSWLTLTDNGGGSATLTGKPPVGSGGTIAISLVAANAFSPDATQTFTLSIDESPTITSPDNITFTVGSAGTFAVTTGAGFPTATALSEAGDLPDFVTFVDNHDGTATLSGVPDSGTGGVYPLTLSATASGGVTDAATQSFTLTVDGPPKITSANHATFTVGTNGSFRVNTTAGHPATTTLSQSGPLPSGVAFVDNHDGTATLSGSPAAGNNGDFGLTITASNGVAPDSTQHFTLTVNEPPHITSDNHATFVKGTPADFTVTTSSSHPTDITVLAPAGDLPAGMTFTDNGDGTATIGGTPTADGVSTFTITASNGVVPDATQTFTATVDGPPTITSAGQTTFTVGTAGSFSVTTAAGHPAATTVTKTGALPNGVRFVDNNDGTATLAGTPAVGTGGSYPLTITASNGINPDDVQSFVLTVNESPHITSANHATFVKGTPGSFTVTTSPSDPPAVTLSAPAGDLPAGMSFTDNGDGTATLAGTPTADGVLTFTITASNGVTPDATQTFTATVDGPPTITSANHATFTVGTAGSFTVVTTVGTPIATAISASGPLPNGVTFVDNNNGTATLSGTPASGNNGDFSLTITASNGIDPDATQHFTLTVNEAPHITSANHATFVKGTPGSFTVTTSGSHPEAVTLSAPAGDLPAGLSFTDNGDGTATIDGTPTADGVTTFTITASNGVAPDATQDFTATVEGPPTISSDNHATFTVGTVGSFTVTTTAGTPSDTTLHEAGLLPNGVTFVDNNDGTATLSGTPGATTGRDYVITITASNGVLPDSTQTFMLTVNEAPRITSADHATFSKGTAGSFTVKTSKSNPQTVTLSAPAGDLPAGMSFTDNGDGSATIDGTPTADGVFPFTITASNGVDPDATQTFTATVNGAPSITSADNTTFTVGTAGSFSVTTTAGTPTATTLDEKGDDLPNGVTFVDNGDGTATLAGTPAAGTGGIYSFTIIAGNGVSKATTQSFTLSVDQAPLITSANHTTFTIGSAGSVTMTSTGFPAGVLVLTGDALPSGVTFTDNGDGTATLAGTPAAGSNGSYALLLTATNSTNSDEQTFTLTVSKAAQTITVTTAQPTGALVGGSYAPAATSDSLLTVAISIDDATTNSACSLTGSTVNFDHTGTCVVDFDQAGNGTFAAAPQVQQSFPVSAIGTGVALVSSGSPTVFGQPSTVTATVTAGSGTPAGSVQFAVGGSDLGSPVTVSGGTATSPTLADSSGHPLAPGSHAVTAVFTPTDQTTFAGSTGTTSQVVNQAATDQSIVVNPTTIVATVTARAPGAGTPTGTVSFTVGATNVGSAMLVNGVATLHRTVPAGMTQQVASSYAGDVDFTGSSASTARTDPTITATVTSHHPKTGFGWYRSAVTVTFDCTTHGAPLTTPCPSAVTLTHNGAGQSVTRTITATDGGAATAVAGGINIDGNRPHLHVRGVRNGAVYDGPAPKARCVATDPLSGVASCRIVKHTHGTRTAYRATAKDRAGNKTVVRGSYRVLGITLLGAHFRHGAFRVRLGHTYTLVAHATSRPTYYDAAPFPTRPFRRDQLMRAAGHHRWALGITMSNLPKHRLWNLGVKIGRVMHVVRIRVIRS